MAFAQLYFKTDDPEFVKMLIQTRPENPLILFERKWFAEYASWVPGDDGLSFEADVRLVRLEEIREPS